MDSKTRQVLYQLQDGFKLETRPFKRIALEVGCTEEEVIEIVKENCKQGIIRRIGVAVRPEHTGHKANALVAWKVSESEVENFGNSLSEMRQISHCYDRECPEGWDYNMFTMIHARTEENLRETIDEISERFKINDYKIFKTVRELKKTSMRYFEEPEK